MSLLLGLPYGPSYRHCEMDPPVQAGADRFMFHLTNIMGDVIDRNLNPSPDGNYMETVRIEGDMMKLADSMSSEWWSAEFPSGEEFYGEIYPRLLPQVGNIETFSGTNISGTCLATRRPAESGNADSIFLYSSGITKHGFFCISLSC